MFKFLKDKLKKTISGISDKIEEQGTEETIDQEEPTEEDLAIIPSKDSDHNQTGHDELKNSNQESQPSKETKEKPTSDKKDDKIKVSDDILVEETDSDELFESSVPEKKNFFSRIKDKFKKKEDITSIPEEQLEEMSIEEQKKPVQPIKEQTTDITDQHRQKDAKDETKVSSTDQPKPHKPEKTDQALKLKKDTSKEQQKKTDDIHESSQQEPTVDKGTQEPKEEPKPIPDPKPEPIPEPKQEPKKPTLKLQKEPISDISKEPEPNQDLKQPAKEESFEEEDLQKKGFFSRIKQKIITKKISESQFEEIFWDLELILLENNVAVEVIEKIKSDLKEALIDNPIPRGKIPEKIKDTLRSTISELFIMPEKNFLDMIDQKRPFVICFFGINGSGKTTSIAKVANLLKQNNISCILAASDTFRAAAIDQLQTHAENLGIDLVKHDYGSDPAAVAFDAIKKAKSKGIQTVLIDTAGRMHSNSNLMEEMKKIIRVAEPDLKIFVGESITGNDCTEQAKKFNESVGLDGIILSKADIDEKGGASISVSYVTKKPILFIGTGQEYDDLKPFDKDTVIQSLGL